MGTCVSLGYDPLNCCSSSDPTSCLQNFAHGSGSGGGGGGGGSGGGANVCASVLSILDTCFTLTPSLSPAPSATLDTSGPAATALASCACYDSSGAYAPAQFDGYASDCQASGSSAHPTYFPLVTPFVGFCTNNAGAAAPGSAAASTTVPPSAAATASTQPGLSAVGTGTSALSAPGGQSAATATGAGTGSTASAQAASTSKSGGVKVCLLRSIGVPLSNPRPQITLQTSALLLLGFSMLFSLH